MITVQKQNVSKLTPKEIKKLKILHQKLFDDKLLLFPRDEEKYDHDDIVYTCTYGKSKKYVGMAQIRYMSPDHHFDNEKYDEQTGGEVVQPYLIDSGVLFTHRRKGIGSALINYIKNDMDQYDNINLDILNAMRKDRQLTKDYIPESIDYLIDFYKKCGFTLIDHFWYHPDHPKDVRKYSSMTVSLHNLKLIEV